MKPNCLLRLNSPAPQFIGSAFHRNTFIEIDSLHYLGRYTLLFFYLHDFSPISITEIFALHELRDKLESINVVPLACSSDSLYVHRNLISDPTLKVSTVDIEFPLISDMNDELKNAFRVQIKSGEFKGCCCPSVFLIDRSGVLKFFQYYDYRVGRNLDEIYRTIQAVIYMDENGEIDPMNWVKS